MAGGTVGRVSVVSLQQVPGSSTAWKVNNVALAATQYRERSTSCGRRVLGPGNQGSFGVVEDIRSGKSTGTDDACGRGIPIMAGDAEGTVKATRLVVSQKDGNVRCSRVGCLRGCTVNRVALVTRKRGSVGKVRDAGGVITKGLGPGELRTIMTGFAITAVGFSHDQESTSRIVILIVNVVASTITATIRSNGSVLL